ncbi:MAG: branched-chain amino acid ABC transporter permease [Burkholderiaceae bacterium]|nr:branched-chain amino acid ABC transporter permease [Burkholderiaceae bacterium]
MKPRFVSWVLAALVLLIALVPIMLPGEASRSLVSLILIWSIFAIGFDLVFGVAGMLSFGHAAMFGTGAYALTLLTTRLGWGFLPAFAAAGIVGALVAVLFSFFALRVSGLFFALLTLALAQLLYILAGSKLRAFTGGVDGLPGVPRPELWGIDFYDNGTFYYFILAVFAVALLVAAILRSSPYGQALRAVKGNEVRAEQIGFDIQRLRQSAFAISGFYAGISGALLASLMFYVGPQMLHWSTSGDVVIMVLLGGMGTLFGPILGVAVFELLREWLSQVTAHWYGVLGLVFIVATIFAPQGLAGLVRLLVGRSGDSR